MNRYLATIGIFLASTFSLWNTANAGELFHSGFVAMDDEVKIYYEAMGQGEPLLLIHGGDTLVQGSPYSSSVFKASGSWDPQFEVLSKSYKVIRFDIRGFGKSGSVEPHPIDNWKWGEPEHPTISDVTKLLDFLEIEKFHVLGLSIGSAIAAQLVVFHPERVNKLMLVSPWAEHTFKFFSPDQVEALNHLKDKTLLVIGANDYRAIAETKKGAKQGYEPRTELVENAAHFVNTDQPDNFTEIVLKFFGD